MYPEQRKLAESCNDLDRTLKRLKKTVDTMGSLEMDSRALANSKRIDSTRKKQPDDPNALDDWEANSVQAAMIKTAERHNI